jgi:hypothetical protein
MMESWADGKGSTPFCSAGGMPLLCRRRDDRQWRLGIGVFRIDSALVAIREMHRVLTSLSSFPHFESGFYREIRN